MNKEKEDETNNLNMMKSFVKTTTATNDDDDDDTKMNDIIIWLVRPAHSMCVCVKTTEKL